MPLNSTNFALQAGGYNSVSVATQHAYYAPDNDSKSDVAASGYFNGVSHLLAVGNRILCDCDDRSQGGATRVRKVQCLVVDGITSAGVVTTRAVWAEA